MEPFVLLGILGSLLQRPTAELVDWRSNVLRIAATSDDADPSVEWLLSAMQSASRDGQ